MNVRDTLYRHLLPPLGAAFLRLLRRSMRIEGIGAPAAEELGGEEGGNIFAFWHSRLLLMPFARRGRDVAVLISRHRDGELVSRTMARFGISSVRGSSSRGGARALLRLQSLLGRGVDVAVTPDGPRGPRERVQPGVIRLARMTGRPIYPVSFAADRCRRLSSWDRFQVPKFFARGVFVWGRPLRVGPDDDLEGKRRELEEALRSLTADAERRVGGAGGPAPEDSPPARG